MSIVICFLFSVHSLASFFSQKVIPSLLLKCRNPSSPAPGCPGEDVAFGLPQQPATPVLLCVLLGNCRPFSLDCPSMKCSVLYCIIKTNGRIISTEYIEID